jgi:hypothetical protein
MRATLFGIVLILVGCKGEQPGASPTPSSSTVGPTQLTPADMAPPKIAAIEDKMGVLIYCPVAGMKGMEDCCPGGWCGRKPKPGLTTAYKGGVVQFCCKECIGDFKNSTSKFAAVANHQLVATRQAKQERCPVTGDAFDPAISAEVAGVVIRFANDGALATIRNSDEAQRVILVFGDSAFGKAFRIVEKK